jgi:WhiB family redox-sensing transcriptional regulator
MLDEFFDQAACRGAGPEWFFPDDHPEGAQADDAYDRARAVCTTCPVRLPCLGWALGRRERHGMWGGLTPAERRSLRRRLEGVKRGVGIHGHACPAA